MKRTSVVKWVCLFLFVFNVAAFAGDLEPSGPPAPTMKPLDQVEPRTPITSVPFTITQSGSYYFVKNLTGTSGTYGITVDADNVSIDLCGFALVGAAGSWGGIFVDIDKNSISVTNGTISGWGSSGVYCGFSSNCTISNIRVCKNGSGIWAGKGSVVSNCTSMNNLGDGFYCYNGSSITNCVAKNNGSRGIYMEHDSVIIGCTASNNGDDGIYSWGETRVDGCVANFNKFHGINTSDNCVISNNLCIGNGTDPSANYAGIRAAGGSRVENNNVIDNDYGIWAPGPGNVIIKNSARGNTVNDYELAAGNTYGTVINMTAGGEISSTNPWANFRY